MAIKQYLNHLRAPTKDAQLSTLKEQTYSTKGLLTMLGDYWVNYYKDTQSLSQAVSGYVTSVGKHLTKTFELVRSGNILNIPPEQYDPFNLLLFKRSDVQTVYDADGNVDSLYIPLSDTKINSIEYLTTSLFESDVVLCKGEHFDIIPGDGIYFYVDIFNDPAISTYSYHMGEGAEQSVLLWGNKIVLSSYYIYQRYGRFLYKKASDSYQYKWIVTSLMRYYTGAKTCNNVRDILDILFGIPYARYGDETIQELTYTDSNLEDWWSQYHHEEASYIRIVTDKATYYSYATSTLKYKVGDVIEKNELFCKFSKVLDYIVSPKWWITDAKAFPENMFVDDDNKKFTREEKYDLMDRILKYNSVYLQLNIDYDSYSLFRNLIRTIREIIRIGFPVYLNPYVEVDLHCLLLDNTDFEERWAHSDWLLQLTGDLTLKDKYFEIFKYEGAHYYNGDYYHRPFLYTSGYIGERLVFYTSATFKDLYSFARKYDGKYWYEGMIYHRASTCEDRCIVNLRWHKPWEDFYDLTDKTHEHIDVIRPHYDVWDKIDTPEEALPLELGGFNFEDVYYYRQALYHNLKHYHNGAFRYDHRSLALCYDEVEFDLQTYFNDAITAAGDNLHIGNAQLAITDGSIECVDVFTTKLHLNFNDDTKYYVRIQHNFTHRYGDTHRYDGMCYMVRDEVLEVSTKLVYVRGVFDAQDTYKEWAEQNVSALKLAITEQAGKAYDALGVAEIISPADKYITASDTTSLPVALHIASSDSFDHDFEADLHVHVAGIALADSIEKLYPVVHDRSYRFNNRIRYMGCETWIDAFAFSYCANFTETITLDREDTLNIEIHKV